MGSGSLNTAHSTVRRLLFKKLATVLSPNEYGRNIVHQNNEQFLLSTSVYCSIQHT